MAQYDFSWELAQTWNLLDSGFSDTILNVTTIIRSTETKGWTIPCRFNITEYDTAIREAFLTALRGGGAQAMELHNGSVRWTLQCYQGEIRLEAFLLDIDQHWQPSLINVPFTKAGCIAMADFLEAW